MKDETKINRAKFKNITSILKNENNKINTCNQVYDNHITSKIQFLTTRNERSINKNTDIIFLNDNIGININALNIEKNEEKLRRQSVGVNTSKNYENKKIKKQKIINFKPKIYNPKPYSDLFKKYIIAYEENNKIKNNPEQNKEIAIPKLKLKKKFKTISVLPTKRNKRKENNRIMRIKEKTKESLLTYNFIKDTYSKEQRLLLNISNNNFENKNHNKLKKANTKKNIRTMIYSNEDFKSMSSKSNKIKNFKLYNKTNLFHKMDRNDYLNDHSVLKDIKTSFCNSLLKDIFTKDESNKKENYEVKILKKEEVLKLMEYPDSIFNYILQKLKEYNSFHNKRNGFKIKLENMKNDLKLIEQRALYQLINLKYVRVPGEEINIKTNLFCTKNKNNLHL